MNVGLLLENAEIVSMRWFSSCMEEGAPVEVTQEHQLKEADKKVFQNYRISSVTIIVSGYVP